MPSLITTYHPKKGEDIIGQEKGVALLKDFILNYKAQKKKVALVYGPIGCGKTSSVYALADELGFDLIEINSSQKRNKDAMEQFLKATLGQQSLFMRPKIILIDEIDNFSGRKDRGGIQMLIKCVEKAKFPVIMTANDPFDSKYSNLRKKSQMIEFQKINYMVIFEFLQSICQKENILFEEKALKGISRQCGGDIRGALIDLETLVSSKKPNEKIEYSDIKDLSDRKRTETILYALNIIFKTSSADTARTAFNSTDVDPDKIFSWLDENVPREYKDSKSLHKAYEMISRSDIFRRRIRRRQHWRYLVYIFDLLSAGIALSKSKRNPTVIDYKASNRPLQIWLARNKLAKKKGIATKLAKVTHVSEKVAFDQVDYLRMLCKDSTTANNIKEELELTSEEAKWLTS